MRTIKSKPKLSVRQQMQIVNTIRSITVWVVLPSVVLCLVFRAYYWQLLMLVIMINLVARFGKRTNRYLQQSRRRRVAAKIEQVEAERQAMLRKAVNPTPFTVGFLREKGIDTSTIVVDDPTHVIDVARQFFNPFRRRDPEGGGVKLVIHRILRVLTRVLTVIWVFGWITSLVLLPFLYNLKLPARLSGFLAPDLGITMIVGMTLWTAIWLAIVLWFWPRDRFVITKEKCWVISKRWPFQNGGDWKVGMDEIQSVNPTIPFFGQIFGYAHLQITSWQAPEPIPYRKFVRDYRRVCVILDHYASGSPTMPKQLHQQSEAQPEKS